MAADSVSIEAYSFAEHQHRIAAWAAGRAAFRGVTGGKVKKGKTLLMRTGIDHSFTVSCLADTPDAFGLQHRQLCVAIIDAAKQEGISLTHGRAAKLLNVYFKVRFVCGPNHDDPRVRFIHPPIDRELLNSLACNNVGNLRERWAAAREIGWSRFAFDEYESVIDCIKIVLGQAPFGPLKDIGQGINHNPQVG